jgi:acetyltransferase-like isoleucine patch superfamily enzyme
MSGVRVYEHGLLGSMGVATKDIDPYTIAVGIPAKPVKVKTIAPQTQATADKTGT